MIRTVTGYLLLAAVLAAMVWAVSFGRMPPAEFTFCNGEALKTLDPAQSSSQPDGRVIWALFEGLTRWDPKTLEPIPGSAERWEVSDDGRTYLFHIRPTARWSDGTPVTAEDFEYSLRRVLHPTTAADYAKEMWYVVGAKKYTTIGIEPGDPVEIELHERPPNSLPHAGGVVLHGRLVEKRQLEGDDGASQYLVEVDGRRRLFQPGLADDEAPRGVEPCRIVTYDFRQVGIKALDKRRLEIRLDQSVPYFLSLVGFYPFSPVNRRCVETHGNAHWTKPENMICNGAFTLEFRRVRDRARLARSETYWNRDQVKLTSIDALAVKSATTMLNLYLTGEADWITTVPPEVYGQLRDQFPDDLRAAPFLAIYYYLFNTEKPPLDDPRVRRAMTLALDRREITDGLLKAGQIPAYSIVPEYLGRHVPYEPATLVPPELQTEETLALRIEEAQRLLAEAGYPGGEGVPVIELLYNTSDAHRAIAELVQSQWKRHLGLNVRLANQEFGTYLKARSEGRFEVARAGWIGDYASPRTFLDLFTSDNPQNHARWSSARYDQLMHDVQDISDTAARMKVYQEAEEILMRELPVIPIYGYVSQAMVRPYVKGFHENLQDVHPLWALSIDEAEKKRILQGAE